MKSINCQIKEVQSVSSRMPRLFSNKSAWEHFFPLWDAWMHVDTHAHAHAWNGHLKFRCPAFRWFLLLSCLTLSDPTCMYVCWHVRARAHTQKKWSFEIWMSFPLLDSVVAVSYSIGCYLCINFLCFLFHIYFSWKFQRVIYVKVLWPYLINYALISWNIVYIKENRG